MKRNNWKAYLLWIALCEATGGLSALLTMDGMKHDTEAVVKPSISPPPILFPIVWTILFALMGIGMARISLKPKSGQQKSAQNIFVIQLVFNFFWTLLFFNAQVYGFCFLWILLLWILILGMILIFRKIDLPAALLQIPYLIWVSFAALLNYLVWRMN